MANYTKWFVTTRRFKVKDPEEFKAKLEEIGLKEVDLDAAKNAPGYQDRCWLKRYRGFRYLEFSDGTFCLCGYDPNLLELTLDPEEDVVGGNMVKEAAEAVRDHIREGETAVFRLVSHKLLGDAKAYVVVVNRYGVESMTLEEAESVVEKRLGPLRQGVKRAAS